MRGKEAVVEATGRPIVHHSDIFIPFGHIEEVGEAFDVSLLNILSLSDWSQLLLNLGTILWVLGSRLRLSKLWENLGAHVGLAVPRPCPVPAPRSGRLPVFVCTPMVIV